jgi:acyl carrier protein
MDELKRQIKEVIISSLQLEDIMPEQIQDDAPLFNEGLGLDSIDALELGVALKKNFGMKFSKESEDTKQIFSSVNSLAQFVSDERKKQAE